MRRFILQANVAHFQKLVESPLGADSLETVRRLLFAAQRELALLEATEVGVDHAGIPGLKPPVDRSDDHETFRAEFEGSGHALILLDPGPALQIVDANEAYRRLTGRGREALVGKPVFEAFPENPDDAFADGMANYYRSLRAAVESGATCVLEAQRYDVVDPKGRYAERYWRLRSTPVFDGDGRLTQVVTEVDEVTDAVLTEATPQDHA